MTMPSALPPAEVLDAQFPNALSEFVFTRSYARWNNDLGRRETWVEAVSRYCEFLFPRAQNVLTPAELDGVKRAVLAFDVMPSMRLLWSAGAAAERENLCAYNCGYRAITDIGAFAEIFYVLLHGTGVGFSVERRYIEQLPRIKPSKAAKSKKHTVEDSSEGWARALSLGLHAWCEGEDVEFDLSCIRPAGTPLRTKGGRASGPRPFGELLSFVKDTIRRYEGKTLSPIACHDIVCKIADCVYAGGIKRAATLSLSDLDDQELRDAKLPAAVEARPYRRLANNSATYLGQPVPSQFFDEWCAMAQSGSGERGIFNRSASLLTAPRRKAYAQGFGVNPCSEVILRADGQLCNLTEIVARPSDTVETLISKARVAAILGTLQATLTKFNFLPIAWRANCEEERLLGCSLTGQMDCGAAQDAAVLSQLRETVISTNRYYSERLGLNPSVATTCIKPSGTVSLLANCAPGMHPRYAQYYIRRVRLSAADPLCKLLRASGAPMKPDVGQVPSSCDTWVVEFPVASPEDAVTRWHEDAFSTLARWKTNKRYYAEHSVSCTVYVEEHEWPVLGQAIFDNLSEITGLSFLPKGDGHHVYQLAPYEEISVEEYNARSAVFPDIDYSRLRAFEDADETLGAQELACVNDSCEL